MLAIHNSNSGFHIRWKNYLQKNNIPFKVVNCYSNNLISDLLDCDKLLWHHNHLNQTDLIIAKQILFALEQAGKKVFPNFNTNWYFDDKIGQKYLLEAIEAPMVASYVFYNKKSALDWLYHTSLPIVFKLRGGAGSRNVKLIKDKGVAKKIINQAFGSGISNYNGIEDFFERYRKYKLGLFGHKEILKGFFRIFKKPPYADINGKEKGYVYFQDFISNNDSDTRIIVIGNKAFALKRYVRKGDFRASGSGSFEYQKKEFDIRCIKIAFDITKKLDTQCLAFDFIFDHNNNPLIVEISFGFSASGYDDCPGYWKENLDWIEGKFDPQGWIIDLLLENK